MRTSLCVLALSALFLGCSSAPTTDAAASPDVASDAGCFPVLHVCVTGESGGPSVDTTVSAALDVSTPPSEGRTGADGCVDLDLTEGTWQVRASTASMCVSMIETVVVPACGTVEHMLTTDLCAG